MRQGDGAQDRPAAEPRACRGLRRQHHRPLPRPRRRRRPLPAGDGRLPRPAQRNVRGGNHGPARRSHRPRRRGNLRRPRRHRLRPHGGLRRLQAQLLQPRIRVDPQRQPRGQDRRLRAGDGEERVLADRPAGGGGGDSAPERGFQERVPLPDEVRGRGAACGASRRVRVPDHGVRQREVQDQVIGGARGEARRGVPLQDPALRAEVREEHHEAGDGPPLRHRLPHEADELPLLPDRLPVGVPAVHAQGALRRVPPCALDLRCASHSQAGVLGGGD